MSIADPTPELLLAYALGALPAEDDAAVRRWLLVQTDERVLDLYRALQQEADRRRARFAHWAARPVRARLERAAWRARARIAEEIALLIGGEGAPRAPALTALAGSTTNDAGPRRVEVAPASIVDVAVESSTSGHLAVFGIDARDALHVLRADRVVSAPDRTEAEGFLLEGLDDVLDLYVIFSRSAPIPTPASTDDAAWLADVLAQIEARDDMSFLRCVFTAVQAGRGKQR